MNKNKQIKVFTCKICDKQWVVLSNIVNEHNRVSTIVDAQIQLRANYTDTAYAYSVSIYFYWYESQFLTIEHMGGIKYLDILKNIKKVNI